MQKGKWSVDIYFCWLELRMQSVSSAGRGNTIYFLESFIPPNLRQLDFSSEWIWVTELNWIPKSTESFVVVKTSVKRTKAVIEYDDGNGNKLARQNILYID